VSILQQLMTISANTALLADAALLFPWFA